MSSSFAPCLLGIVLIASAGCQTISNEAKTELAKHKLKRKIEEIQHVCGVE